MRPETSAYSIFYFSVVSLDVMDISGELQRDISHNILKVRLDSHGVAVPNFYSSELRNDLDKMNDPKKDGYCGSCYGGLEPEGGCCNSCEEVRQSYINRGWSFANPDAIEQVSCLEAIVLVCLMLLIYSNVNSARVKDGQTS